MFERVPYSELNLRHQKKNYIFHKVAALLADYGFNSLRLTDDWQIACHVNGETFLKVQLKTRLAIDRKYEGKAIHVAFIHGSDTVYLYDHDRLIDHVVAHGHIGAESVSWHEKGIYHWPKPPSWAISFLEDHGRSASWKSLGLKKFRIEE